jgi:hypothetical protein
METNEVVAASVRRAADVGDFALAAPAELRERKPDRVHPSGDRDPAQVPGWDRIRKSRSQPHPA